MSRLPVVVLLWVVVGMLAAPGVRGQSVDGAAGGGATSATQPSVSAVPAEVASPRATMTTFLKGMNDIHVNQQAAWPAVLGCFDFTGMERTDDGAAEQTIASQLYEIVNRIETINLDDLPDARYVESTGTRHYVYFPRLDNRQHRGILEQIEGKLPGQIALRRQADGRWLFSARTVEAVPALHAAMAALPVVHDAQRSQLLASLGPTFERTRWWDWGALLLAILVGLTIGKSVQYGLRSAGDRLRERRRLYRGMLMHNLASPLSLLMLALALQVGLGWVYMAKPLRDLSDGVVAFLHILSMGWFLYNAVDVLDLWLRELTAKTDSKLDDMVVPLIRKALRIFLVIVFTLVVAQNVFGLNITGWLAGLGIAGLAVSLAAQDSVKNLFGSITVFFDKPFVVGDFISFDGQEGVVEEIGFRSTRMRTLDGHLVTVPNMKFIDNSVRNVTERRSLRRVLDVTITYDTPVEKIERAVQIIKDILGDPEFAAAFNLEKDPPRVVFNDFNAASLNIRVMYWYVLGDGRDFWSALDFAEKFNLRLFRAYAAEGIEFAFPTQTLFLAGDPNRPLSLGQPRA